MAIVFGLALAILIRARRHDREVAAGREAPGGDLRAPATPAGATDLLDFRADPEDAAPDHDPARWPALDGGADPAGGIR